ncbi:hypothetical protein [Mucilaginibacter sp. KACC 22063]|uniref:hypothetical protein n=1 Tax=Mucilaginibacter sp. KACC 22063 TaxID=3025666 RepID=UPI002366F810|nr:hypothetical protein [Mucilaginibacter sp. KACC 22063]WDF56337.1 hypothetical protein PQ461_04580 [Mucilaginibacter sp. KACC 22063]
MNIMVFKTSVTKAREVSRVKALLTVPAIKNWNFDLDDCDRILRVITDQFSPRDIESMLQGAGFACQELED